MPFRKLQGTEVMMNERNLVMGPWVATWTNLTSSASNQVVSYAFAVVLGLFVFNADGTVHGEFRMKDGTTFNVRTFTGNFAVTWDATNGVFNGTATVTIDATGNVNTLNFVRVNSDELAFVLEKATKADSTLRSLMIHGSLHRVRPE
jgi:hypothetical protein